jgi:hypothetical protein
MRAVLDAVGRAIRLYGSYDCFGEPRWSPEGQPYRAADFPAEDDTTFVYVGAVPADVQEDISDWTAVANSLLDSLFGRTAMKGGITGVLERRELLQFDEFSSYITLLIDHPVSLPEPSRSLDPPLWYDPFELERFDQDLRAAAADAFDLLTAYVAPIVGAKLFAQRLFPRDRVLFKAQGQISLFYPRMTTRADISVGRSKDSFPDADLRRRLGSIAGSAQSQHAWLGRAMRLYAGALSTTDRWRRFQALFSTLELLAHKLGPRYRESFLSELAAGHRSGNVDTASLNRIFARPTLVANFAIAAISLSPEQSTADLTTFVSLKDVRDRMSHGQAVVEEELPIAEAEDLAERYVALAARVTLGE